MIPPQELTRHNIFNPLLHIMSNAPTFWLHMMPWCTYPLNACDARLCHGWFITLRTLWQIGVEQIHLWICATPIWHKAKGLCSDRLPLVQFGVKCVQEVCASGIICIQKVGAIWRQMQQRVELFRPVISSISNLTHPLAFAKWSVPFLLSLITLTHWLDG